MRGLGSLLRAHWLWCVAVLVAVAAAVFAIVANNGSENLSPQEQAEISHGWNRLAGPSVRPPRTETIPGIGAAHFLYGAAASPNSWFGPMSIRGPSSRAVLFVYTCAGPADIQTDAHFSFGFVQHVANNGHLLHMVNYHVTCSPTPGRLVWHRMLIYPYNAGGQRIYPRGDYRFAVGPAGNGDFAVNVYLAPAL